MREFLSQKTVHTSATLSGVALHSGQTITLGLRPAPRNTGIVFNRVDVSHAAPIEALAKNVVDTRRATTIAVDDHRIGTVEHLLSALYGLGVDNAYVDVDGEELPAGDGSAGPYVDLIHRAGIRPQHAAKKLAVVRKSIAVHDGDAYACLSPAPRFSIDCDIAFEHPLIGEQQIHVDFTQTSYVQGVAKARTFAFFHEVQWLREHGLALGGSLDNCIVIDGEKVMNSDGLRYADEFVRHKVLDAVGDMALFGMPLIGNLHCHKAGHKLHHMLLTALLADASAYEVLVPQEEQSLHVRGLFLPDWTPAHAPMAA